MVLSQLDKKQYGYSLKQLLAEQGVVIEQGTLYPLLRRLEKQGLLESKWSVQGSRPRRYYVLSEAGCEILPTEAIHRLYLVFRGDSRAVPGLSDEAAAR